MSHATTAGNVQKVSQLEKALAEMLAEVLRRGFFGNAEIQVSIQDGTIQHIRRKVERVEK
jgi:hypothetical protein